MTNRTSRAIRGSITGMIQNVLAILFQLIITPLILIQAGQVTLGGYAIVMQVVGYGMLLDFGFSVALTRYLCQFYDQQGKIDRFNELLTVGRSALFITNLLACMLLVIAAWNIELFLKSDAAIRAQAQLALVMMGVWMVVRTPVYIYGIALTATQNMAALNVISIGTNLIRLLTAMYFTYCGFGLVGLIGATILAELTGAAVQRVYFGKLYTHYAVRSGFGNIALGKELLRFGLGYFGVNLAVVLMLGSDSLIVGALYGAATASIFYSTKMFGSLIIAFISRIIDHIYPGLNELIGKNDMAGVRSVYLRMLRYVLLLAIPSTLGIVLFVEPLVTHWVGKKQFAGEVMAVALALFVFIQILNHLHGILILAIGKLRHWSLVSIGSGILSVGLGYSMGKFLGMEWILIGMSIAMLPMSIFIIHRVVSQLEIGITIAAATILPSVYASLPLVLFFGVGHKIAAGTTVMNTAAFLALYFFVWIAGTWLIGLNKSEKLQIQQQLGCYVTRT